MHRNAGIHPDNTIGDIVKVGGIEVPVQAIQALPYVLTVVLLAGFIGKAVGPKAGGVPYTKER